MSISAGKGTSGMDKFGSIIDRMNMKLGSKFLDSLRIKTQLLKSLQRVIVVDGATRSQKDGVEGNGGPLRDGVEAFMLFLRGAQLVLHNMMFSTEVLVFDRKECPVSVLCLPCVCWMWSVRLISNNNLACVLVLLVTTNHGTSSSNRIASIGSLCHAVQEVALFCMTCEQTQDKAHALLMCRVSLLLRVWSPIFWVR